MITKKQLKKRVKLWNTRLPHLGLGHFKIHVDIVPQDEMSTETTGAQSQSSKSYDTCWIEFSEDYLDGIDDKELDKTIVHELLHVVFRDFDRVCRDTTKPHMAPVVYQAFESDYVHEYEGVVERMARSLVDLWYREGSDS